MKQDRARKITILFLATVFVACCAFLCALNLKFSKSASAAAALPESYSICLENGASIRLGDSKATMGMRFSGYILEDDYNKLAEKLHDGTYKSVYFGVAIAPNSYITKYGALNETNLFDENDAVYDWATYEGDEWVYNGTKTRIMMFYKSLRKLELEEVNGEDHYSIHGAITNVTANMYKLFTANTFIEIVDSDDAVHYVFPSGVSSSPIRSVAHTVQRTEELYQDQLDVLDPESAEYAEIYNNLQSVSTIYGTAADFTGTFYVNQVLTINGEEFSLGERKVTTTSCGEKTTASIKDDSALDLIDCSFDGENAKNPANINVYASGLGEDGGKNVATLYYKVSADIATTNYYVDGRTDFEFTIPEGYILVGTDGVEIDTSDPLSKTDYITNHELAYKLASIGCERVGFTAKTVTASTYGDLYGMPNTPHVITTPTGVLFVKLNGDKYDVESDQIDLSSVALGDYTAELHTADTIYTDQTVINASIVVYSPNQLYAFSRSIKNGGLSDEYVILIRDIDVSKADEDKRVMNNDQSGTTNVFASSRFNGLGHTISNMQVTGGGLFGPLYGDSIVENVAFINCSTASGEAYIVGHGYSGTIRNIYAQMTITAEAVDANNNVKSGFIRRGYDYNNVIIDLTYTSHNPDYHTYALGPYDIPKGSIVHNALVVSNVATTKIAPNDTDNVTYGTVYTSQAALYNAQSATVAAWGGYWDVDDFGVKFNNSSVIELPIATKSTTGVLYNGTIDFDNIVASGRTVAKAYINGEKLAELPAGNEYAVSGDLGDTIEVIVIDDQYNITKQDFVIASALIDSVNAFKTNIPTTDRTNATKNKYFVLIADLDFEDENFSVATTWALGFAGHLNGLGHTISNVTVTQTGGLFGSLRANVDGSTAMIENVSFVNINRTATSEGGILFGFWQEGATIKNVYVKASRTCENNTGYTGIGIQQYSSGVLRTYMLNLENCIIDIQFNGSPADTTYVVSDGYISATNVYAIGNASKLAGNNTTVPYASQAALLAAQATKVASWGGYWSVESGEIYFNGTKVVSNS